MTAYALQVRRWDDGDEELNVWYGSAMVAGLQVSSEYHVPRRGKAALVRRLAVRARARDGAVVTLFAREDEHGRLRRWNYASRQAAPDKPTRERRVALALEDIGPHVDRLLELYAQRLAALPAGHMYALAEWP